MHDGDLVTGQERKAGLPEPNGDADVSSASPHPEGESEQDTAWSGLRFLLLRFHFYGGVLVAPFLLVAATTGLLYVFTPQLEQAVYDHELHVPAGEVVQPLAAQVEAARSAHPQDSLKSVRPGPTPSDTTQVIFNAPDRPDSFYRTVFVNPYTTEVRGVLETYGTSQALPLRTWIDQLHQRLHLGEAGRLYSELAASWLWVIALGGVVLWLRRPSAPRLRSMVAPTFSPPGRRRVMSWHGAVGLWAAIGFVFLSATGLTWSLNAGEHITALRSALAWETPTVSTSIPPAPAPAAVDVGVDRVLQSAREQGLSNPVEITLPAEPGETYVVQQIQRHWPEKQDSVAVEPATGRVTDVLRFADYPLMAKLSRWGIDAHTGLLFGWVNQVALALLALGLICMIFWGYRMWWLRRPARPRGLPVGRPPDRGAWRRVPGRVLAPIILAAVFVGYFVPLLGASLVLFLVLDISWGAVARRRADRTREAREA